MPTLTRSKRTRGHGLNALSDNELRFVKELLADDLWRPTQAARRAGYSQPASHANRLMKKPEIAEALGKEQRRRLERLELKAEEVLHMLATGLFFNPLSLFKPSKDGKWVVEDLDKVPDEIGRCVEKVKCRTTDSMDEAGNVTTTTYFELELLSKTKLLELAMKHCGVDGVQKHVVEGNVGIDLSGGLNGLLMHVEQTRRSQVVDSKVIDADLNNLEQGPKDG